MATPLPGSPPPDLPLPTNSLGNPPGGGADAPDPFEGAPAPKPRTPSVSDVEPLAPTAFQEKEPAAHGRRWVVVLGVIVVFILLGVIGFAVARIWLASTAETGEGGEAESEDTAAESPLPLAEEETSLAPQGLADDQAILDDDLDGLTVAEERFYGTDAAKADSDGDGFNDGEEVRAGYDPLSNGKLDSDNDGFPDPDERGFGSDPFNPDTDGDGYSDGDEIENGYNPLVPSPGDKL